MRSDMLRKIEVAESSNLFSQALQKLSYRISVSLMNAGMSCGYYREYWLSEAVRAQRKLDSVVGEVNSILEVDGGEA